MKAKDITVGEFYAVGHPDFPQKAMVTEVGEMTKRVHTGARWDFSGHPHTAKMARVRYENTQHGEEEIVQLTQVLHPWAVQEEINERVVARQRKERGDYAARQRRAVKIRERLIGMVDDAHASFAVDAYNGKVTLTFDEFAAVVGEDL